MSKYNITNAYLSGIKLAMHEFLTPGNYTFSDTKKNTKAQLATASVPIGATLAALGTQSFLPDVTKAQKETLIDIYKKLYPGREIPRILEVKPPESFWKKLLQRVTTGTYYSTADKSVFLYPGQKDTAALAHELGHAMSKPLGNKLYRALYTAGKFSPLLLSSLPIMFRGGLPEEAEPLLLRHSRSAQRRSSLRRSSSFCARFESHF
jgi:hypothetical protein